MKLLLVAGVLALPACSILYNPNNLGDPAVPDAPIDSPIDAPDAAPDAPTDAAVDAPPDMPTDAPPDAPQITLATAMPNLLDEGAGIGGSRPALVILTGTNFISPTFTVSAIDDGGVSRNPAIVGSRIATSGTQVVLALQVPVLTTVGQGNNTKAVRITASQLGFDAMIDIPVKGLDELSPSGTVDTATLRTQYSRATFSSAVHFTGAAPALVRVTSDITITAAVDVDGVGQAPGAHGCGGGAAATDGGCGAGGGGGGNSGLGGSPGGGGGFGSTGGNGAGTASPGGGGATTGEALLLSLTTLGTTAGNRGNGGGGGGGATLGGGGPGGGGAGVIELTAGGTINVSGNGAVRARGGNGTPGGGVGGGNGGGGSGGAIVIRSGNGIASTGAWISAPGGTGAGSGNNKAGDGGTGRVRLDTTTTATGLVTGVTPTRGPAWATNAPTFVGAANVDLGIVGGASQSYGVYLNGAAQPNVMTNATGAATASLVLATGLNTACTTVVPAIGTGMPEATRCIDLVYLP